MEFTQEFVRNDGVADVAKIKARKVKFGFVGIIKIGALSKIVTATHLDVPTVHAMALRVLLNYRDNAIV